MMENPVPSIEQGFSELEEAKQKLRHHIEPVRGRPKIQRVPAFLRERKGFEKYYTPKVMSIGPINHDLKLGEEYKLMLAAMYTEETDQRAQDLYQKIEDNISELRETYTEDAVGNYNYRDLAWMLFLDGCSVLEIMRKLANQLKPDMLHFKADQLAFAIVDMFLLENQLPFKVLRLLCNAEETLFTLVNQFILGLCSSKDARNTNFELLTPVGPEHQVLNLEQFPPVHLLDYLRTNWFAPKAHYHHHRMGREWSAPKYQSIQELKRTGIRVKKTNKARQNEITFKSYIFFGKLYLSRLVVEESTAPKFLNLIAYEMCPDFENDFSVTCYVAFMDSLIHGPRDVKDLRFAEVLHNLFGSDEEVVELFKILASDLKVDERYLAVMDQMENHNRRINWLYHFYSTEFSTEWSIIGSIAALAALVLTAIQTWFALPFNSTK